MRVVESLAEFDEALTSACREAKNAFGNPDMLIERYLTQPGKTHEKLRKWLRGEAHSSGRYPATKHCRRWDSRRFLWHEPSSIN
jgi:3-methylcrotonyl-CoA carboxylase alpha subunit